jgi:hypothetical protein
MTEKSESRSDSDAQLVTFTGHPGGGTTPPMEIRFIPTVTPTLAVEPSHPTRMVKKKKRVVKKKLTPAQKRAKKIRLWMLRQHKRPDLETYRREMDEAQIAPPPACLRAGKRTFEESLQTSSTKQVVTAEFSRLWRSRSPS